MTELALPWTEKYRPKKLEEGKDPYGGGLFQAYKKLLLVCMRGRYVTITPQDNIVTPKGFEPLLTGPKPVVLPLH